MSSRAGRMNFSGPGAASFLRGSAGGKRGRSGFSTSRPWCSTQTLVIILP